MVLLLLTLSARVKDMTTRLYSRAPVMPGRQVLSFPKTDDDVEKTTHTTTNKKRKTHQHQQGRLALADAWRSTTAFTWPFIQHHPR